MPKGTSQDVSQMVESEEMPYWVKTVDQNMRHTSYPELWNKDFRDDGSMKYADAKSSKASSKVLKHKTQHKTPRSRRGILGVQGSHSDTASLTSHVTSSTDRRKRKRSRRLGIFLALLLLAFLLAALLGWLIYYWLRMDDSRPEPIVDGRKVTNGDISIRILNETYVDAMDDRNSTDFQRIAQPLCESIDAAIQRSNLTDTYHGCQVLSIRHIVDVEGCQCRWTRHGNLLVNIRLSFNGSHDEDSLGRNIYDVIEASTTKHVRNGIVYILFRDFIVDIQTNWRRPYDALHVSISLPVFNLNYTKTLEDNGSPRFQTTAASFCQDVGRILRDPSSSMFWDRYWSCRVSKFSTNRDRITFNIILKGKEWRTVQKMLLSVLYDGARVELWENKPSKWIGTLVILPYNIDFIVRPINASDFTTLPPTTPTMTTSTTTPYEDIIFVYVVLPTYNLTLTPGLRDPKSLIFKTVTKSFCDDLARLYSKTSLRDRYFNCSVLSFRSDPTSLFVAVGYKETEYRLVEGSVKRVIRGHAPGFYLEGKEVYLVGGIYLLFGEIRENGLELHTNLRVVNLTFTPDLNDRNSPAFQYHARFFCQDMAKFYTKSFLKDRFFSCGVNRFLDNPVRIHFYLVFYGTDMVGLPASVVDVIRRHAPPYYYNLYLAYLVGDLLVLPEYTPTVPSVTPTNITVFPTSTVTPSTTFSSDDVTPSMTFSDSVIVTPDGILLILYYEVYNLTYTQDLRYPNSKRFLREKDAVCDDIWRWYLGYDSPFRSIYRGCDVTLFTFNPEGVTFTLLFETKLHEDFIKNVRQFLEYKAPKVFIPRFDLLDVGNLLLIMDRYRITVSSTMVPSDTLVPPSMTTETITMTSFTITPTTTLTTPSSTIEPTTTTPRPLQVVLSYPFGLADFVYTTDLQNRNSARFQFLERRFCKDIESYYRNSFLGDRYASCRIDGFSPSPKPQYPEKVYFTLTFDTPWFYEIQEQVVGVLFGTPPRVPKSGYMTLHVGDLFLIIDTYTTKLPDSLRSDIDLTATVPILTVLSPMSELTPSLPSISVSLTPLPEISTTTVMTVSPTTTTIVTPSMTPTPMSTTPSTTPSNSTERTYFIRMSFETLNLTYYEWLNDKTSKEFINIEKLFCADIDKILNDKRQYFPSFMGCQIDVFGGNPLRVNFSLQFRDLEGKKRSEVKDLVVAMLIENALRREYNNIFSLLVGNLLIVMDSISVAFSTIGTTSSKFDAIAYDFTFYLYPGNTSYQLMDKTSQMFKEESYKFCRDVDNIFASVGLRTVRNRYHGCVVDSFGTKREVRFKITLRGTDVVRPSSMFNIFAYSGSQVYLDGVFYIKLGDLYVSVDVDPTYYLLRLESFTTHSYPFTTTTVPNVNTLITLTLEVLRPDWSIELDNMTSARYRLLADSFCSDVSTWISEWKTDFIGCGNVFFSQNPFRITAELTFRGLQTSTLENDLNTIILERADRVRINNLYAMSIGSMLIYDKSLVLSQRTISINNNSTTPTTYRMTTSSSPVSTPSTPASTTPFRPCLGVSNLALVAHPSKCDRFYQCVNGQAYPITCTPGSFFEDSTCVEKPPGFECPRGQG